MIKEKSFIELQSQNETLQLRVPLCELYLKYLDYYVVVENATHAIFTYEDPRSEDPMKICEDIISELKATHNNYEIVIDRREAITKAVNMAGSKDMVLILGKGNETYEKLKDGTIYFNDMEEAYNAVAMRKMKEENK